MSETLPEPMGNGIRCKVGDRCYRAACKEAGECTPPPAVYRPAEPRPIVAVKVQTWHEGANWRFVYRREGEDEWHPFPTEVLDGPP